MQGRNARRKLHPEQIPLRIAATILLSLCLYAPFAAAEVGRALIVGQKAAPYQQDFMEGFRQALTDAGGSMDTVFLEPNDPRLERYLSERNDGHTLLITVGSEAAFEAAYLQTSLPSLNTLIPQGTYKALARESTVPGGAPRGALFVDQPVERFLELIRVALPQATIVGSLQGPYSQSLLPELRLAAANNGLKLIPAEVERGNKLERRLEPLLAQSQVLLTLPDAHVVNSTTAKTIILSAYLRGVPIVGYSESYVKAGALMAVYSTARQLGRQTAEIALAFLKGGKPALPAISYPRYFSIAVNYQIAQALNLRIPSERKLLEGIKTMQANADD